MKCEFNLQASGVVLHKQEKEFKKGKDTFNYFIALIKFKENVGEFSIPKGMYPGLKINDTYDFEFRYNPSDYGRISLKVVDIKQNKGV